MDRAKLEAEARHERAHRSFLHYMHESTDGYAAGWFHRDLCARLERFAIGSELGQSPRLILSVPPRHGKTLHVGERLPAWFMRRNPGKSALYWTHSSQPNAVQVSLACRREAERLAHRHHHLSRHKDGVWNQDFWQTLGGGEFRAVGVGGGTAGFGAEIAVTDDPFGNREQAESERVRNKVWSAWQADVYSRVQNGGGLLINHTRWHDDDLVGHALRELDHEQWDVVVYPALAVEDEPHRKQGDALAEWLRSREFLERIRRSLHPRIWEALYQGSPIPPAGSLWHPDWLAYTYPGAPKVQRVDDKRIFVDANFRETEAGSFFVAQVWGYRGPFALLLDQIRGRWSYTEGRGRLRDLTREWSPNGVHVEGRANGDALVDELSQEIPGVVREEPRHVADRKYRDAEAATPMWQAGNVMLPEERHAPWVTDFRTEHLRFPHGSNDDQVDAASAAVLHAIRGRAGQMVDASVLDDVFAGW